ncbi:MAG: hypothetical protein M1814_002307 [Vezdaea aestivalis]|nr:MAG: hypothetical protein M1814_002307 [Vezdaea aestivalis]
MSLTHSSPDSAASAASAASSTLRRLSAQARDAALTAIHRGLTVAKDDILAANSRDLAVATKAAADGTLSQSILKRLDLNRKGKWEDMLKGILDVQDLDDPVGKVSLRTLLDDGLELERRSCPIGVLLIIFEARPEVIANIASLAIKSANAAILKGGKESTESFIAISTVISRALDNTEVPNGSIQLLTTRDSIPDLLKLDRYIDLVIPRGSNELVQYIQNNTRIPVMGHADGLCIIYLHNAADPEMAMRIICDAKLGYPAACNAVETLLVDDAALSKQLPPIAEFLINQGVSLRCDIASKSALTAALPPRQAALLQDSVDSDYDTEFLDLILAIKTIPHSTDNTAVEMAVAHINSHSSHHTDCIITMDSGVADTFKAGVDSAGVFWNTSPRMADGMRYGFGTEVGISTNKIHARGPVGLEGLTIYQYYINGSGQVPGDFYEGEGGKKWKHQQLPLN